MPAGHKVLLLLVLAVLFSSACTRKSEMIEINAFSTGDKSRLTNLEKAAVLLNKSLEKENKKYRVKVNLNYGEKESKKDIKTQISDLKKNNLMPDIICIPSVSIPWFADNKFIVKMNKIKKSKYYEDAFPSLWDTVKYNGSIWGIFQDTEVRPMFINKNILLKMGWKEEDIRILPDKIRRGLFTIDDMVNTAESAVNKGFADYGIIHRPDSGVDFQIIYFAFGGRFLVEDGRIIINENALSKMFDFFSEITANNLIPKNQTTMKTEETYLAAINGKVLFYFGGIWHVNRWTLKPFHEKLGTIDSPWISLNFLLSLYPTGVKGQNPLTLSKSYAYCISSATDKKEIIYRLLDVVTDPAIQAEYNLDTYHLPITVRGMEHPDYRSDVIMGDVVYMLDYTTTVPIHSAYEMYEVELYEAIRQIETKKDSKENIQTAFEKKISEKSNGKIVFRKEGNK